MNLLKRLRNLWAWSALPPRTIRQKLEDDLGDWGKSIGLQHVAGNSGAGQIISRKREDPIEDFLKENE